MNYKPSELIIGYLKETLDKKGIDDFYKWVNETPENKKLFFEAKAIFDAIASDNPFLDIDQSWIRLLDKKASFHVKQYPLWKRISKYAAVATIAIILTSVFFIFHLKDNNIEQAVPRFIAGNGIQANMIIMPDGTKINVGSRTIFHYSPDYGKKDRIVYLEGEAFFDVAKKKDKPFIVKVKGQDIIALGTKFNVMAYPSDSISITTLLEGSISFSTENKSENIILKPDQQFVYNKSTQDITINEVESLLYTSWINGYYYFPDQNLESIFSRLSNLYGIEFKVTTPHLNNKNFTGTFYKGQSIKDILEIINLSIPIKYTIKENHVIITE